jgi:hypothetical protein
VWRESQQPRFALNQPAGCSDKKIPIMQKKGTHGSLAEAREIAPRKWLMLLQRMSLKVALRDISLLRSNRGAFGEKRTSDDRQGWVARSRLTLNRHCVALVIGPNNL